MKQLGQSIKYRHTPHWFGFAAASILAVTLAGCGGGSSSDVVTPVVTPLPTVAVPTGNAPVTVSNLSAAQFAALTPTVTVGGVAINSPPVVTFAVSDGPATNNPIIGLGSTSQSATATLASYPNISFSLAKLVPGTGTAPSKWVSYIVTTVPTKNATTGAITASVPTRPSTDNTGTLVDNKNGTYTYTFYRDITKVKTEVAAAAETAVNKNSDLGDLTYEPTLVHRLTIQISGNAPGTGSNTPTGATVTAAVPMKNPVDVIYDFIPATGKAVTATDPSREITATVKCNECHAKLGGIPGDTSTDSGAAFHGGSRNETKYCVVCHTEQRKYGRSEATTTATGFSGSTYRINDIAVGNFPNQIHKIHFGKMLSKDGYDYGGLKFKEVKFPQDARNCTKCHDASATSTAKTAQGDNWLNVPSRVACGGCHDGINFAAGTITKPVSATRPVATTNHFPGPQLNDSGCATQCHTAERNNLFHLAVTPPSSDNALLAGGTNTNTNAAWIASNTSRLPAGAIKVTYDIQSVSRNADKRPVMVFRLLQNGVPVPLIDRVANPAATEIWANFMGAPSVYFVYAMPQDGITAPADFNASASVYLRSLWNESATGTAAGTLTYDATSGYYTATLTGVTIPDAAVMLTGGLGYSYNVKSTLPLTQTNLPDYPTAAATGSALTAGMPNKTGGLIVVAPNVQKVAAGYNGRRTIVSDALCNKCHQELGAFTEEAFHGGQRNDGTTCSWCHTPNRASSGWSADSTTFVHAIHAGAKRETKYNWHAISSTDGFWDVKYPGVLKNCEACHLAGTYDFSAAGSAVPSPNNRQYKTVMTGNSAAATFSTSPYVAQVIGTAYGGGYSVSAATGAITAAAGTTLVTSPITAVCFACHDNNTTVSAGMGQTAVAHMKAQGGSIYEARSTALLKTELCNTCHGTAGASSIGSVHSTK
jgi:OmcA/MtrC family decaheme c-type cytochrome